MKLVYDSFGRIPSGFQNGEVYLIGDYLQCLSIQTKEWNSKYCLINKVIDNGLGFKLVFFI